MQESPNNQSLIRKEQAELEAAPFLFSEEELPKIDKTKPKFHCTGERLFRDRPDVYKAVVRMLAEPGVTILNICQTLHVTDNVVRSVKARENIAIAHEKKTVLANITHGMRLASERVIELMPTASARDALIGVGILGDKMALLSGEVTARIEVGPPINIFARFQQFHDETVRRIEELKRAKVLGVRSDTGLNSEKTEQKALTLTNGDHKQAPGAQNGLGSAVIEPAALTVAEKPAPPGKAQT